MAASSVIRFQGQPSGLCPHYCQHQLTLLPTSALCHLLCMPNIGNKLMDFLKHFYHAILLLKNLHEVLIVMLMVMLPQPHAIFIATGYILSHL